MKKRPAHLFDGMIFCGQCGRRDFQDSDIRKVSAYTRVSTDHEEQQTSYEAQVDYYTNYLKGRGDWEFVSVYTDKGISATSTTKRDGFNKMVADALDGRIDLIITKSVSRFARNTIDNLITIRKLKEHKVECYFEKENIWTFDSKVTVPFKRFLGYDRGGDGNLVINEGQAVVVWRIYGMFLRGRSPFAIAKTLTEEGIPTRAARSAAHHIWMRKPSRDFS